MEQFRDAGSEEPGDPGGPPGGPGGWGGQGGPGGAGGGRYGGGGLPGGCLFGRMRIGSMAEEEGLHERPPIQSVAALGLLIAVVCLLALWFLAR